MKVLSTINQFAGLLVATLLALFVILPLTAVVALLRIGTNTCIFAVYYTMCFSWWIRGKKFPHQQIPLKWL